MTRIVAICVIVLSGLFAAGCGAGGKDVSQEGALDKYNEIEKQTKDADGGKGKAESRE